ncbi:hypothetical protein JOF48_001027 [Arthrobacter stackebrandtii]|uniref:DUF1700 domain-containing protein n=1 Tax=Arthrobacter stackebrandtii TaxID=272161 RepID=A0ABS4YW94_9MICC|nr:hypothetical protein [Arthrobacter stackebrandtii]MBP2412228.1 hypothetical protein [Arthrobacter stackebrandtii]PYH02012.1 hypothetical protein CVV67_00785 [Arthrobacter stackebrandtii]
MTDAIAPAIRSRRSIADRLRIDAYMTRFEWHLEGGLPGGERKAVVKGLREELAADPRETGAALRDLGTPRTLAARYTDEGALRPLWSIGIVTAGAALLVYWILFLTYALGMLAVVDGASVGSATSQFLFIPVQAFSSPEGFGIGWTGGWAWLMVPAAIVLVAFLAGARIWRAFRR